MEWYKQKMQYEFEIGKRANREKELTTEVADLKKQLEAMKDTLQQIAPKKIEGPK